jgi:hypothetical protein
VDLLANKIDPGKDSALLVEGVLPQEEAVERLPALLKELRLTEDNLADTRKRLDKAARELAELTVDDDPLTCGDHDGRTPSKSMRR